MSNGNKRLDYGDEIRRKRQELGLSQRRLAEMAKLSPVTLRRLELEKLKPQKKTLERIMKVLKKGGVVSDYSSVKDVDKIYTEVLELQREIEHLKERVYKLENQQEIPNVKEIILRKIDREQARREIEELFKKGSYYDPGEIADILRLDIRTVVDICNELIRGGIIGE